jgi:resuscitation-promoting factor RpfB
MLGRYTIKLSTGPKNLWTTRPKPAQVIHNIVMYLRPLVRCLRGTQAPKGASLRTLRQLGLQLCLCIGLLSLQTLPTQATTNAIDAYKIYAHIKVGSYKEFVCLEKLWTKESNWRYKAKNKQSSAYGIPQLLKMKETNPYKQIDLGLRYIDKRYKGNACAAWQHWRSKGWY